jgi:hypothetical protein
MHVELNVTDQVSFPGHRQSLLVDDFRLFQPPGFSKFSYGLPWPCTPEGMLLSLVNGGGGNLILEALNVSENYSWVNSGV